MLKDANNANNIHNSYTGRATTASITNYRLSHHSVCVILTRTMLTPEQLIVELCFSLVIAQCTTVSLCTSIVGFLTRTTVRAEVYQVYLADWLNTVVAGHTAEEKALVNQWMEYRITTIDPCENDTKRLQCILKVISMSFHISQISSCLAWVCIVHIITVIMAALRSRYGHYIFALWFFFLSVVFSSPNLSHRWLDVYTILPHMVWP